jgi:probable rRNA maturation factor
MSEGDSSRNSAEQRPASGLAVEVVRHGDAWEGSPVSDTAVELAARAAFAAAPPRPFVLCEVTIVLTDDHEMRSLNSTWRGMNKPTNVLSFPTGDEPVPGFLGDVVIAYETARGEARDQNIAFADHVAHLVAHGMLHLLGFDHLKDDEAERMEDLERKALASLDIDDPYAGEGEASPVEVLP